MHLDSLLRPWLALCKSLTYLLTNTHLEITTDHRAKAVQYLHPADNAVWIDHYFWTFSSICSKIV